MIVPFLCFYGKTEEAVKYYQSIFEFEEPQFLKFSQVLNRGFEVSEDLKDGVMFTEFKIGETTIMACDAYPGLDTIPGQSTSLNLILKDEMVFRRIFNQFGQEGRVGMSLQKTLWAPLYGSLVDKYGVVWQLSLDA